MGRDGFPLVSTPEQVADDIVALHRAGFGGTTLSFELPGHMILAD